MISEFYLMLENKQDMKKELYDMSMRTEQRVCTCGPGYFCTFECEFCDAFKVPEE